MLKEDFRKCILCGCISAYEQVMGSQESPASPSPPAPSLPQPNTATITVSQLEMLSRQQPPSHQLSTHTTQHASGEHTPPLLVEWHSRKNCAPLSKKHQIWHIGRNSY